MNFLRILGLSPPTIDQSINPPGKGVSCDVGGFNIYLSNPGPCDENHVRLDLIFSCQRRFLIEVQAINIINGGFTIDHIATMIGSNRGTDPPLNQHWHIQCVRNVSFFDDKVARLFSSESDVNHKPSMVWERTDKKFDGSSTTSEDSDTLIFFERIFAFLVESGVCNENFLIMISDNLPALLSSNENTYEN